MLLFSKRFWIRAKNVAATNIIILTTPLWSIPLYFLILTVAFFRKKNGKRDHDDQSIIDVCFKGDRLFYQEENEGFALLDRFKKRELANVMLFLLRAELLQRQYLELVAKHGKAAADAIMEEQQRG